METRRPVSPGAEQILGSYFPVLDHGFVALVDYMGTDESIEHAARVSYGYGTRRASLTRGLLRYLRRHLHTTPSEMVELKFHCCMPMFVARQWIRHRTACLSGDAELIFDLPGAAQRGRRRFHKVRVDKFFDLWTRGTSHPMSKKKPGYTERVEPGRFYTIPELAKLVDRREETLRKLVRAGALDAKRTEPASCTSPRILVSGASWREFATTFHTAHVPMRERLSRMQLRSCNEQDGEIVHTRVASIWQSGVKPVFRVTLENGYSLKMSKDHRCLTEAGWKTLAEATGLRLSERGSVTWDISAPAFSVNGVRAHADAEWLAARRSEGLDVNGIAMRAGVSYHTIRQIHHPAKREPRRARLVRSFAKIARIEYVGEEMTYDLEVTGPWHNFVANGFIVHNSVNEYSGRYSLMPMLFYTPSEVELQTQSSVNNQGRSGESVGGAAYREAVNRWNAIRAASSEAYEWMTGEGIARELARIDLPLSTYTQWYWKIDLHNLLHFLKLRVDAHAQWEIQEYGRVMAGMLKKVAPLSYEAWIDYDVCGARLSRMELEALRRVVEVSDAGVGAREGEPLDERALAGFGLSKREIAELRTKLTAAEQPDFELDLSTALSGETFAARFARAVPKLDKPPSDGD